MQTDLRLNQTPLYLTAGIILLLTTVVPVYLSFHFSKIGITRYLILTGISYLIAVLYILAECLYYQKLKRAIVLPLVDGKIIGKASERWTRNGVLSKCIVELNYMDKKHRFVMNEEYRNIMDGATVKVLFDENNPQKSILVRENRYLKISRSTLKDN